MFGVKFSTALQYRLSSGNPTRVPANGYYVSQDTANGYYVSQDTAVLMLQVV